jgi:uracil-DNA glycosylase
MAVRIARSPDSEDETLEDLLNAIRACRICRDEPRYGKPLPHEPRPILQVSRAARICIASQAPGTRVHDSGRPFDDPSGVRLRDWMGISEADFYDASKVAIIPMGFCFPGLRSDGSDLPPRRECAEIWRTRLLAHLPNLELLLAIGGHAQRWHLGKAAVRSGVDPTVRAWRSVYRTPAPPRILPLPHPSWHNNRWITRNPWFEAELLLALRADVRRLLLPG